MPIPEPLTDEPSKGGLPRGLQVMIGLGATVIVIGGLMAARDLIGPAFLALVLVIVIQPVRAWLTRKGLPGWLGSLIAGLGVYAILLGLAFSLVAATARFATLLPAYADKFNELVDSAVAG